MIQLSQQSRHFFPTRTFSLLLVAVIGMTSGICWGQTSISVDATQLRGIGGISTLDRTRFFNHHGTLTPPANTNLGDLANELSSASGLNSSTGRMSSEFDQFISNQLGEDATRPGFIDPTQLRQKLQGDYRNFVTQGSRWKSLRENPNAFVVNTGRSSTFWPAFMRTDPGTGTTSDFLPNKEAYAEFLSIYLDEVVYGQNSFMPVATDRFQIELLNEPDLHINSNFTAQDMADYHRDVTRMIKAQHPTARIGGPSLALTSLAKNNFARWNQTMKPMIETAGADLDFYSIHPYERYDVANDGSWSKAVLQSPGRVNGLIDLIQTHHENVHGDRKSIAFTEYGSFNFLTTDENGDPSNGNYARDLQQWDLSRDIRDKMFVFLNRPDTVLNATPFVAPRDWRNETPTSLLGDNVFWEQDANGDWHETIVANMFRSFAPVQGEYIGIAGDNRNIQSVAFRDGNKVYLMLNNLLSSDQEVNLEVMAGSFGSISSATIDRIYRAAGQNTFIDDFDITNEFQNLVLNAEEGAVITFVLDGADELLLATNEETFYGDRVVAELNLPTGQSPDIAINADIDNAIKALLRINYNRPSNMPEAFDIYVNGNLLSVSSDEIGWDDDDFQLISREIEVPLGFLIDGTNLVRVDFTGDGGYLSTGALVITSFVVVPEPGVISILVGLGIAVTLRRRRASKKRF